MRRPWLLARWVWSVLVMAWTVEIIRIYYSRPITHSGVDFATSIFVDSVYGGLWFAARRESRRCAAVALEAEKEAAKLRQLHAPDATAGQCPVCGMDDLDQLAADDRLMERGPFAKVVAYGLRRAHWECAEFVPYVPTAAEQRLETHRREHAGTTFYETGCEHCRIAEGAWERRRYRETARQQLRVASNATEGSETLHITGEAPGHMFLIKDPTGRHMEIVTLTTLGAPRNGHGLAAGLASPLRHSFPEFTEMVPISPENLWHRGAGRPFTRTELGLCECGTAAAPGRLRASVFDAYLREAEAKIAGISADLDKHLPAGMRMLGDGF
jgi:hypothetical protein